MENQKQQSLGEYRVGISHETGNPLTDRIKRLTASFIDCANSSDEEEKAASKVAAFEFKGRCAELESLTQNPEARRCFQLAFSWAEQAEQSLEEGQREIAVTQFEAAGMWAVRGAAKPELPEYLKQ